MSSPLRFWSAAILVCGIFFPGAARAGDGPGFRRFAQTISPDGAYFLAWGSGYDREHPETCREWSPGTDSPDGPENAENYLVDARLGRVLVTIAKHDFWVTSGGQRKQAGGLTVVWSEDGQSGLAIYGGNWRDDSILWIDPKKGAFVEVYPLLEEVYRRYLQQKLKVEDAGGISFRLPAILPGGVLVIDGRAQPKGSNEGREYNDRLKLHVKFDGEAPKCALVNARKAPEPQDDVNEEDELNKAYQAWRARLPEAQRAELKARQLQWLKLREALSKMDRNYFTQLRTAYLRARAEN